MFYITKPVVFTVEDEDVANEIKRLSKDEFSFSNYISGLVENDIKTRLGKNLISEKAIVNEEVTSLTKRQSPSNSSEPYAEILSKLDLILSMGSSVANSNVGIGVNHSVNINPSTTFVEPPKDSSLANSLAIDVEHQSVPSPKETSEVDISAIRKKKKKKMGIGKGSLDVLNKMKSMQK